MSSKDRYHSWFTEEDIVDVEIERERGEVVGFAVNLRSRIGGEWREVIRYDTRHGALHVHRFWRAEEESVEYLEGRSEAERAYGRALDEAIEDIRTNWRDYRARLSG